MKNIEETQIPYNKPHVTGNEKSYVLEAINHQYIAGGYGQFSKKCMSFFNDHYGFENCLLTHSCSGALEIAATLCDLSEADEVIIPSFAYVTTAASFDKTNAKLVFADSQINHPNICPESIRNLITKKTKVLVIVHYAGVACLMDEIMRIVEEFQLILIEDCAHAVDAYYKGKALGSFGHFSTFSFHETKNIHCGEGGLLVVNDQSKLRNALQIWQEGTNKSDFESGLKSKYEWVSTGSSYQPSELSTAFLYGQLLELDHIQNQRKELWSYYYEQLSTLASESDLFQLPGHETGHNAHIFYLKCLNIGNRNALIQHMKTNKIMAIFHYLPLHISPYQRGKSNDIPKLINTTNWSDQIIRLPLYIDLTRDLQDRIISVIHDFFQNQGAALQISKSV